MKPMSSNYNIRYKMCRDCEKRRLGWEEKSMVLLQCHVRTTGQTG